MITGCDERFPKSARIRKRLDYLAIQDVGIRVVSSGFIALVVDRKNRPTRLGIITSKRFGNAVARNRIRRLIREAFRRKWIRLPDNIDIVLIPKKNVSGFDSKVVFSDLDVLGKRVLRLIEKN